MDLTFKCPHCSQPFEADRELCGSTCSCPSCGQFFIVPDDHPSTQKSDAVHDPGVHEHTASQEPETSRHEIARLRSELQAAEARCVGLENELLRQNETEKAHLAALEADRDNAKARAFQADSAAKESAADLAKLRADFEKLATEKNAAEQNAAAVLARETARVAELEAEHAQAKIRALEAEAAAKEPAAELAKLRTDFERLAAEKDAALAQVDKEAHRVAILESELEEAKSRASRSKTSTKGAAAELAKLRSEFDKLAGEKNALEQSTVAALSRVTEREAECEAATTRATHAEDAVKQAAAELTKLRAEFNKFAGEKTASEQISAQALTEQKARFSELEKVRAAADLKYADLEREHVSLRTKFDQLSKAGAVPPAAATAKNDPELARQFDRKEKESKKLSAQLAPGGPASSLSAPNAPRDAREWLALALTRREPLLILSLFVGLLGGVGISRLMAPSQAAEGLPSATAVVPIPAAEATPNSGRMGNTHTPAQPGAASGSEVTAAQSGSLSNGTVAAASPTTPPMSQPSPNPGPSPAPVQTPPPDGTPATPNRLPDSFLGIKFGASLKELPDHAQWQATAGRFHRKAELLNAPVEAVLSPDDEGHLMTGAYIRIVGTNPSEVTKFLEWAIRCQDAVSALYGSPSELHQIENAPNADEVVRKISAGEDRYEAVWRKPGEDTFVHLHISQFNSSSIVFRLEYANQAMAAAFAQRKLKQGGTLQDTPPDRAAADPPK